MILVTGGSGVVGGRLVRKLYALGQSIRVVTLPHDQRVESIKPYVNDIWYADISIKSSIDGVCFGCDTVYHCASIILADKVEDYELINQQGTRNLLEDAIKYNVHHFIYVSSASVIYKKPTQYSLSKSMGERLVQHSGLNYTIIRPTLVYDVHKGGQEFDMFCAFLLKFPIVPFIGAGRVTKRPVFVDDLIDGFVKVLGNAVSYNKVYNFSGKEQITLIDFARLCLKLMHKSKKKIIRVPVILAMILAITMKYTMRKPLLTWQMIAGFIQAADLNPQQAIDEIGYNPRSVSEMLPSCFPRFF